MKNQMKYKQITYDGRLCHLQFFSLLQNQLGHEWYQSFRLSNEFWTLLDMFDSQIMRQFEYKYETI